MPDYYRNERTSCSALRLRQCNVADATPSPPPPLREPPQQAAALGHSLADYHIDAIFASNLLRATWTAQQIHRQQKTDPKPPLTLSPLLQEQHFGKAERQPWTASDTGKGYFRESGRNFSFPSGESLNDVRNRANEA
jgi:broad specificity phosphatase PhoE